MRHDLILLLLDFLFSVYHTLPTYFREAVLGKLTPLQVSQFQEALLASFTRDELAQMIQFRLGKNLEALSLSDSLVTTVYNLIEQAQEDDWTAQLLAAALDARPANSRLRTFADQFGLAPKISSSDTSHESDHSEQLFKMNNDTFTSATQVRSHLGTLETQVCQVEIGKTYGTGFLISPDMLMTSYHLIDPIVKGYVNPQQILLRFDYKLLPDNQTVSTGTIYHLSNDWLVDYDDYSSDEHLDFALLRISGAPGNEPIGGERAEPDAPPRGWITLITSVPTIIIDTPLFILHHIEHGPLQLTYHQHGIIGLNDAGTRLFHCVNTAPGSGGAPCFNQNWELIAIHQGASGRTGGASVNSAIPIMAIFTLLRERNTFIPGQLSAMEIGPNQLYRHVHLRISTIIQSIKNTIAPFGGNSYISPRKCKESAEVLQMARNILLDLRQYLDDTLLNPTTSLPDSIVQHYPGSINLIHEIVAEVEVILSILIPDNLDRRLIQRKTDTLIDHLYNLESFICSMENSS